MNCYEIRWYALIILITIHLAFDRSCNIGGHTHIFTHKYEFGQMNRTEHTVVPKIGHSQYDIKHTYKSKIKIKTNV